MLLTPINGGCGLSIRDRRRRYSNDRSRTLLPASGFDSSRSTALPTDYYLLPVLHNRRARVCVCMRTNVCECGRVSTCVLREMRKCKRNKATLSWLRLVCCRHEVPVTSEPITVIHMDEDVVVVNKPASIPVSGVLPELYCQKQREKKNKTFVVRLTSPRDTHAYVTHITRPDTRSRHYPRMSNDTPSLSSGRSNRLILILEARTRFRLAQSHSSYSYVLTAFTKIHSWNTLLKLESIRVEFREAGEERSPWRTVSLFCFLLFFSALR